MLDIIALAFIAGFLVKFSDDFADNAKKRTKARYVLGHVSGLVYGVITAYIIITYPLLAPLGIAVVLSVLFTKKIDHPVHFLGIGSMIIMLCIFGLPPVDIILLLFFLFGGIIDEVGNDLSDRGRIRDGAGKFFHYRATLKVLTLGFSALTGMWIFFLFIISVDAAYLLAARLDRVIASRL